MDCRLALESIRAQTSPGDEVLIACDGPLGGPLEAVIGEFVDRGRQRCEAARTVVLSSPEHLGLGRNLARAVKAASHDIVIRCDADDINRPTRFEALKGRFMLDPELSVCGSAVEEFIGSPGDLGRVRTVPVGHDEIRRFAKHRNPMNHMSVAFRRDHVLAAGSYQDMPYYEDYWLWARMLVAGRRFENIPDVLVDAKVGNGMISRRIGLKMVRHEWDCRRAFHRVGFLNTRELLWTGMIRVAARLLPVPLATRLYRSLRTRSPAVGDPF